MSSGNQNKELSADRRSQGIEDDIATKKKMITFLEIKEMQSISRRKEIETLLSTVNRKFDEEKCKLQLNLSRTNSKLLQQRELLNIFTRQNLTSEEQNAMYLGK